MNRENGGIVREREADEGIERGNRKRKRQQER